MTLTLRFTGPDADVATEILGQTRELGASFAPVPVRRFFTYLARTVAKPGTDGDSPVRIEELDTDDYESDNARTAVVGLTTRSGDYREVKEEVPEDVIPLLEDMSFEDQQLLWIRTVDDLTAAGVDARFVLTSVGELISIYVADMHLSDEEDMVEQEFDTGVPAVEGYDAEELKARIAAWDEADLSEVPDDIWGALCATADAALQAIAQRGLPSSAFAPEVRGLDGADGAEPPVLALTCYHSPDVVSELGVKPVDSDDLVINDLDPDVLDRLNALRWDTPDLVQCWWVQAMRETAEDAEEAGREGGLDIAVSSAVLNAAFPYPDGEGRIRLPQGLNVLVEDTDDPGVGTRAVEADWARDFTISSAAAESALREFATQTLTAAVKKFGANALVDSYTVRGTELRTTFTSAEAMAAVTPDAVTQVAMVPSDHLSTDELQEQLVGPLTSTNAAWVRAMNQVTATVADTVSLTDEEIRTVVRNSAEMMAVAEAGDRDWR